LTQPIDASLIGLPSRGAAIETAVLVAPADMKTGANAAAPAPREFVVTPAAPEYCRITDTLAPVDRQAPPINFQVNLATQWNGRSVPYGGGGFNGVLVTGLGLSPSARPDKPAPLLRGFAAYGTDSGHQNAPGVPLQAFALNDEALINFTMPRTRRCATSRSS
jgi:hypothetical protein